MRSAARVVVANSPESHVAALGQALHNFPMADKD
jgi:hypothetical protein